MVQLDPPTSVTKSMAGVILHQAVKSNIRDNSADNVILGLIILVFSLIAKVGIARTFCKMNPLNPLRSNPLPEKLRQTKCLLFHF